MKISITFFFTIASFLSLSGQTKILNLDCTTGSKLFFIEKSWAEKVYEDTGKKAEELDYINLLLADGGLIYNTEKLNNYSSLLNALANPKNSSPRNMVIIGIEDVASMESLFNLVCALGNTSGFDKSQYGIYFFDK